MNTNQLLSFLTLAETNSYQKTAERLHYSRSTVMDHIRTLEQELGTALVFNQDRKLVLTAAGERFRNSAQSMMQIYQNAMVDAMTVSGNQKLRVITSETLGLYFLNRPLSKLIAAYPEIDLSVQFVPSHELQDRLRRDEADLAVQFSGHAWDVLPAVGLTQVKLGKDEAVFFANPKAWITQKENRCIQDLAQTRFILTLKGGVYSGHLVRLYKETGVHIVPTQYIDSGPLLKHFVLHHDCVSMLSRRVIAEEPERGELVELPLAPEPLLTDVVALYPPKGEKNPALQDFIRLTIRQLN